MIWVLRNISVHLWITTLVAIPVVFYVLPVISGVVPGISPVTAGAVMVIVIALGGGFLMNRMALKAVLDLIKEGQAWERAGIPNKAEKNYVKALRVYDTFLFWPFSSKKITRIISFAIAKFRLNSGGGNHNFKEGTAVYLKMNPGDEDMARLWLAQLRRSAFLTSFEQEVLSLLVESQYTNPLLSPLMAEIFIGLERKDFIAKKLYQQVCKDPVLEKKYSENINALVGESEEILQQEVPVFKAPEKPGKKMEIGKQVYTMAGRGLSGLKVLGSVLASVLSFLILSAGRLYGYARDHEKVRFYLKTGFLGMVSIWLLFLMIGTLSHMFKPGAVEKEKIKTEIEKMVPMPFTIQVAAYLKQEHADRYVGLLKKKQIDAIVKKVGGGGKTWYVVRVSKFVDKESAAAYGQKLKQQGLIDDFFVNNL